jgi:pimeloyl-ACP methyl ester carboxylesterase
VTEHRTITVGGARLSAHLCGSGPLAVLVHGYPLDHRMWIDLLHGPLTRHRTLCAFDLRGHGGSPWVGDAVHTMEQLADDIAAVSRTVGVGSADVVALSMGGYAALALCERAPEALRTLCLVDTRASADTPEGKTARASMAQDVVTNGRRWLAEQMLPKLVAPGCGPFVRARLQTMIESSPVETILADLAGMRERKNRRVVLSQIQVPTMVVVGSLDELTPPNDAEAMAKAIPGAQLLVVQDAGHMVPMERPEEFAAELSRFWGVPVDG